MFGPNRTRKSDSQITKEIDTVLGAVWSDDKNYWSSTLRRWKAADNGHMNLLCARKKEFKLLGLSFGTTPAACVKGGRNGRENALKEAEWTLKAHQTRLPGGPLEENRFYQTVGHEQGDLGVPMDGLLQDAQKQAPQQH